MRSVKAESKRNENCLNYKKKKLNETIYLTIIKPICDRGNRYATLEDVLLRS